MFILLLLSLLIFCLPSFIPFLLLVPSFLFISLFLITLFLFTIFPYPMFHTVAISIARNSENTVYTSRGGLGLKTGPVNFPMTFHPTSPPLHASKFHIIIIILLTKKLYFRICTRSNRCGLL